MTLGASATVKIVGPLTLIIEAPPAQGETQINLDRVWRRCASEPAACEATVEAFVAEMSDRARTDAAPADASALRVVVRTSDQLTAARGDVLGDPATEIVAAPLAGDLWLVCVIDTPRSAAWLNTSDLARLGLSEKEAFALAKRNLAAALPPLRSVLRSIAGDSFGYLNADAYYESSRLLLHEDWAPLARQLSDRLIVAVPQSGLVIYGDTGRPQTAKVMRVVAERAAAEAQLPISPVLLEWTSDGWRLFEE